MNEVQGWIPDTRLALTFLAAWLVVVLGHALWRSLGAAPLDPIRPSGPID